MAPEFVRIRGWVSFQKYFNASFGHPKISFAFPPGECSLSEAGGDLSATAPPFRLWQLCILKRDSYQGTAFPCQKKLPRQAFSRCGCTVKS
jgi:hypothetical protein